MALSFLRESIKRAMAAAGKTSNVNPHTAVQAVDQDERFQRAVNPIIKKTHMNPNTRIRTVDRLSP